VWHIRLLILCIIGFSTDVCSQGIIKDTASKKDTTVEQKIEKIVLFVIKDTLPRKETAKDTILEERLNNTRYGFRQFEHETFLFAEAPARWHKTDWLRVGMVIGITAAIMPFDRTFSNIMQSNQNHYYTVPVIIGRVYGAWYFFGSVTAVSVGYAIYSHNTKAEKIDVELFQAWVYSELLEEILDIGIGRTSPYENRGPFNFHPFTKLNAGSTSMPSGDAISAFALSTITFRHTNSTLIKILAFVPAGFTLFTRIYQNEHWTSDEFFGAAIGFGTGEWVVTLHEGKRHKINLSVNK
jgi:membrane-associated phospholipid phosphatase